MHLKRINTPKTWPIPKTGTKYIVSAEPGRRKKYSVPILIVLRDMLNLGDTKNEITKILSMKDVLVNGRAVTSHKLPVGIFDVISIPKIGKNYMIIFKNRKIGIEEAKESGTRICKVIGKKMLAGKKQQINLFGGNNVLSNEKIKVNDSVALSLKDNKIAKVIPLKENAEIYIIGGSHLGESGTIEKLENSNAVVKIGKQNINISLKNIFVTK
jgi:small subunit ribosomal protein S4e